MLIFIHKSYSQYLPIDRGTKKSAENLAQTPMRHSEVTGEWGSAKGAS